jgi:hypothetical protein
MTHASTHLTQDESERFWSKVRRTTDESCWIWQRELNSNGYGRFSIWREGQRIRLLAHRVAFRITGQPLSDTAKLLHSCDVPRCCNPAHLRPGTQADNMADAGAKGRLRGNRRTRGEAHYKARLTESDVLEIRRLYAAGGISQRALAAKYSVRQPTVGAIVRGSTWTHLPTGKRQFEVTS